MTTGDHDSDSENLSSWLAEPVEDRHTLGGRSRQALGLSWNYVPGWHPRDAAREYFQNWKDGIIESSKLERRSFKIEIKELESEYIAEAIHPDNGKSLGFIRYREKEGDLEFTNFGAQLKRETLDLGVTSKRRKEHLAGTHGEGFKVASLVMVRRGYQVRYEASSYYWSFTFGGRDNSHLYCNISPISETKLEKQRDKLFADFVEDAPRKLIAHNWEDVTVRIGRVYGPHWGEKITKEQFLAWTKVALDLDRPLKFIETAHGTLILDESYSNKVYLKGLLLECNSSAKKFKFGYNFWEGHVNRDRQRLTNPEEEGKFLANVWEEAIRMDTESALKIYVDMLLDTIEWADVNLAENKISESTAKLIWQHLLERDSGLNRFYHSRDNTGHEVELIRRSLRKDPFPLPRCVWNPLRKFKLVRTAQEQRYHLLNNAPIAVESGALYSVGLRRALRAALSLDARTRDFQMVFKSGARAELDLLLDGSQLQINDKCLNFDESHEGTPCWLSRQASEQRIDIDVFSCDHVVAELYDLILVELDKDRKIDDDVLEEKDSSLRLRVNEGFRQMPKMIEIIQGDKPGEIDVLWTDPESQLAAKLHRVDLKCRVTLHRESTCADRRGDLVAPSGPPEKDVHLSKDSFQERGECGCPEQVVLQKESKAIFHDLDPNEDYFPMIARTHPQAFFGFPPNALRPKAREVRLPSRSVSTSEPTFTSPPRKENLPTTKPVASVDLTQTDGYNDLYDASPPRQAAAAEPIQSSEYNGIFDVSSSDETDIDMDSPIHGHSSPSSLSSIEDTPQYGSNSQSNTPSTPNLTNQKAKEEIAQLKNENESQKNQIATKDQELRKLKAENLSQRLKISYRDEKLKEARAQNESQRKQLSITEQKLQNAKYELEAKRKVLDSTNQTLEGQTSKYKSQCQQLQAAVQDLGIQEQQFLEAKTENDTQRQRLHDLTSDLAIKEAQILDAAKKIENLEIREQDANGSIENLRIKIQELQDENSDLQADLQRTRDDLSDALRMASNAAARLKSGIVGVKRERIKVEDDATTQPGPSSKRARQRDVITTRVDGAIDLTDE